MKGTKKFFKYARTRYQIMLDKDDGLPSPWTKDPILQRFRFCNVFREDDTTTRWIRKHISLKGYGDKTMQALMIARWFNRVSTLERLLPSDSTIHRLRINLFLDWKSSEARKRLKDVRPVVTGAYIISTPGGMSKLDGIIQIIEWMQPDMYHLAVRIERGDTTLREATEHLTQYRYMGHFMAYELVTDMRHAGLLDTAPDIMTWANPGPGCARGAGRVMGKGSDHYNRGNHADYEALQNVMQALLHCSEDPTLWPAAWPKWEMREVEHTLCEFDKYERARLEEGRPKQIYRQARA